MLTWMGMTFDIVAEDALSVTIRQRGSNQPDVTIMKDSPRYKAMFAKPKFSFSSLIEDAEQELNEIFIKNVKKT